MFVSIVHSALREVSALDSENVFYASLDDQETPVPLNTKAFMCLWLCKNTNNKTIATIKQTT